jgi:hypothetical protein
MKDETYCAIAFMAVAFIIMTIKEIVQLIRKKK